MVAPTHPFRWLLCLALLLASLGLEARPAAAQVSLASGKPLPDVVLVRTDPAASTGAIAACLHSVHAARGREIPAIHVLKLKTPPGGAEAVLARLRACPGILYAERDYPISADLTPSDPGYTSQWGLDAIRAPQAWDLTTGSSAVILAIVDSGIDLDHPDLSAKVVDGYDVVNSDSTADDDYGHGTHVAGIAAASTDNGVGIAGVSWGAQLMPVKVLDSAGNGSFSGAAEGITWAADHGAQVINMSFGGVASTFPQTLQEAVNYAFGKGVLLVAAAGNDAKNENFYPANLAHVLSVTATDSSNLKAGFANFGPNIDLAAPGVSIYSTYWEDAYATESGTSMAAPFVSGLAAILRGLPGNASPDQITLELESTALDLGAAGRDDFYGFGLIQADAAIQSVRVLTVTRVGTGTVTSLPAGVDCGHSCMAAFSTGTMVTLTAQPMMGATFLGWNVPACPDTAPCTLALTADTAITATFTWGLALPIVVK